MALKQLVQAYKNGYTRYHGGKCYAIIFPQALGRYVTTKKFNSCSVIDLDTKRALGEKRSALSTIRAGNPMFRLIRDKGLCNDPKAYIFQVARGSEYYYAPTNAATSLYLQVNQQFIDEQCRKPLPGWMTAPQLDSIDADSKLNAPRPGDNSKTDSSLTTDPTNYYIAGMGILLIAIYFLNR